MVQTYISINEIRVKNFVFIFSGDPARRDEKFIFDGQRLKTAFNQKIKLHLKFVQKRVAY